MEKQREERHLWLPFDMEQLAYTTLPEPRIRRKNFLLLSPLLISHYNFAYLLLLIRSLPSTYKTASYTLFAEYPRETAKKKKKTNSRNRMAAYSRAPSFFFSLSLHTLLSPAPLLVYFIFSLNSVPGNPGYVSNLHSAPTSSPPRAPSLEVKQNSCVGPRWKYIHQFYTMYTGERERGRRLPGIM